jgi:hypothetical protein
MAAEHVMMQGAAFTQGHADQRALGGFRGLADGFRHFARLAMPKTDATLLVADDDESGETETTAALHDFRDAIDVDQTIHEFAVTLFTIVIATATTFTFTSHFLFPSLARDSPFGRPLAPIPQSASPERVSDPGCNFEDFHRPGLKGPIASTGR